MQGASTSQSSIAVSDTSNPARATTGTPQHLNSDSPSFQNLPKEIKSIILQICYLKDAKFTKYQLAHDRKLDAITNGRPGIWGRSLLALARCSKELFTLAKPLLYERLYATDMGGLYLLTRKAQTLPYVRILDLEKGNFEQLSLAIDIGQQAEQLKEIIISLDSADMLTGGLDRARLKVGLPSRKEGHRYIGNGTKIDYHEDIALCRKFQQTFQRCTALTIKTCPYSNSVLSLLDCCRHLDKLSMLDTRLFTEDRHDWPEIMEHSSLARLRCLEIGNSAWLNSIEILRPFPAAGTVTSLTLKQFEFTVASRNFLNFFKHSLKSLRLSFTYEVSIVDKCPPENILPLKLLNLRTLELENGPTTYSVGALSIFTKECVPPLHHLSVSSSSALDDLEDNHFNIDKTRTNLRRILNLLSPTLAFLHFSHFREENTMVSELQSFALSDHGSSVQLSRSSTKSSTLSRSSVNCRQDAATNASYFTQATTSIIDACEFGKSWAERMDRTGWQKVPVPELNDALAAVDQLKAHIRLQDF
ncbi:hypothetical protein T439DRAFT_378233 [Meredithblackwellia eburnea MCA 4105]